MGDQLPLLSYVAATYCPICILSVIQRGGGKYDLNTKDDYEQRIAHRQRFIHKFRLFYIDTSSKKLVLGCVIPQPRTTLLEDSVQLAGEERNVYKKIKWRIIIFNGIILTAAILMAFNNGFFYLADHVTFISRCLMCPMSFLLVYCNWLPPITSGIHPFLNSRKSQL